jgi:hypothetical protein
MVFLNLLIGGIMKNQFFNGVFVPRECMACSSHPMNAANSAGGTQPTDVQQLKAEIRSLLARYDCFRINDGEKAPGWLLHELRELSAV